MPLWIVAEKSTHVVCMYTNLTFFSLWKLLLVDSQYVGLLGTLLPYYCWAWSYRLSIPIVWCSFLVPCHLVVNTPKKVFILINDFSIIDFFSCWRNERIKNCYNNTSGNVNDLWNRIFKQIYRDLHWCSTPLKTKSRTFLCSQAVCTNVYIHSIYIATVQKSNT